MGTAEALGGLRQNMQNGTVGIGQHVRVPQPDDPPASALQINGSTPVFDLPVDMLTTIELHAQLYRAARQIDDERRDHKLPRKGGTIPRDPMPDGQLGRRRVVAQLARSSGQLGVNAAEHGASLEERAVLATHPQPLP